jgi:hypothetical protein
VAAQPPDKMVIRALVADCERLTGGSDRRPQKTAAFERAGLRRHGRGVEVAGTCAAKLSPYELRF